MNRKHCITETRGWARIVLMAGLALTFIILAIKGELSSTALAGIVGALGWLRG